MHDNTVQCLYGLKVLDNWPDDKDFPNQEAVAM